MALDWDHIRAIRFAKEAPPANWPPAVRPISEQGLALLGVEPNTNKLYWDGKEVILLDRVRLARFERFLASVVAVGAFGSFLGTFGYFVIEYGKLLKWWGG